MSIHPHKPLHGLSLMEISIVLIMLGLLAGGIIAGQSLMRAAELRTIVSDYHAYAAAIKEFRNKYHAMPGDMPNATNFWGHTGGAGCLNTTATTVTTPGTCDGDGDNNIEYGAIGEQSGEAFQGWRQLALAGLIDGNYSGMAGNGSTGAHGATDHDFEVNSPLSKVGGAGWSLSYATNELVNDFNIYRRNYTNWLTIGGDDGVFADDPFLTGIDAENIDGKMDDGMPATGSVQSRPGCTATAPATNADFTGRYPMDTNNQIIQCSLVFKLQ